MGWHREGLTQVMVNKFMDFDTQSYEQQKICSSAFWLKNLSIDFRSAEGITKFWFVTPFLVNVNILLGNFQWNVQSCNKNVIISLPDFYNPFLTRKNHPLLQSYLIHAIAFLQYIHLWAIVFKNEANKEKNFIMYLWWKPWELSKNCNHCHWNSVLH